MSGRFEDWLRNELTELHMHAAYSVPNDFPEDVVWNWEVSILVYFLDFLLIYFLLTLFILCSCPV
jgi:hypothetical protein